MGANLKEKYNLYKGKLDSFRVRIPVSEIEENNSPIGQYSKTVQNETGLILSEDSPKHEFKKFDVNGLEFNIGLKKYISGKDKEGNNEYQDYWVLFVKSKYLRGRYFEGVTIDNIKLVYEEFQAMPYGLKFSLESFMNGKVSDVDVCYDFEAKPEEFKKLIEWLRTSTRESMKKYVSTYIKKLENIGIEWKKRNTGTAKTPYLKVYHKGLELTAKGESFWSFPENLNIGRVERSIRKPDDWLRYRQKPPKSLKELLGLNLDEAVIVAYKEGYYDAKTMKPTKNEDKESYKMYGFRKLIEVAINAGYSKQMIELIASQYYEDWGDKDGAYKMRKEFREIMMNMDKKALEKLKENSAKFGELISLFTEGKKK